MTSTLETRPPDPTAAAPGRGGHPTAFRPAARRRNRIALGAGLGALAVVGNLVAYSSLNRTEPVLQVVRDVPAGSEVTADMLRSVDISTSGDVNVIAAARLDDVVGRHAKVRLVAGSLVTDAQFQAGPLVEPGNAVVAIEVAPGALPLGLREQVPIQLVLPAGRTADGTIAAPVVFPGRVVGLPTTTASALGTQSLSVELAAADAPIVAAADDVRVVLSAPVGADGAGGGGG